MLNIFGASQGDSESTALLTPVNLHSFLGGNQRKHIVAEQHQVQNSVIPGRNNPVAEVFSRILFLLVHHLF